MVGPMTTLALFKICFLKYSANSQSFFSLRCGPCSLQAAPIGMTTTVSMRSTFSASCQVSSSSKNPFSPAPGSRPSALVGEESFMLGRDNFLLPLSLTAPLSSVLLFEEFLAIRPQIEFQGPC